MNTIQNLSRSEMKTIMAGGGGWYSCTCYSGSFGGSQPPEELGKVTCSSGMEQQECCQAHHEDTTATECQNTELDVA